MSGSPREFPCAGWYSFMPNKCKMTINREVYQQHTDKDQCDSRPPQDCSLFSNVGVGHHQIFWFSFLSAKPAIQLHFMPLSPPHHCVFLPFSLHLLINFWFKMIRVNNKLFRSRYFCTNANTKKNFWNISRICSFTGNEALQVFADWTINHNRKEWKSWKGACNLCHVPSINLLLIIISRHHSCWRGW